MSDLKTPRKCRRPRIQRNPKLYVDVHVTSDRFDLVADRYAVIVWAGDVFRAFCYMLEPQL